MHVAYTAMALMWLATSGATAEIVNGDFEEGEVDQQGAPAGWQIAVYHAQPTVAFDDEVNVGEGRSLRIESGEPSDTAIYQDLVLQPGHVYVYSGWVRTRALVADTILYGTLSVHRGGAPYVMGESHGGDTDWTEERVVFRCPADGRIRLAVFLVGFGAGTGTVWFDKLSLREAADVSLSGHEIVVSDRPLRPEPISPFVYGNFIEFLDHHVQGMRAEMVADRSFEGLLPPAEWCWYDRETDWQEHGWEDSGWGGQAEGDIVDGGAFNGAKCRRISIREAPAGGFGIRQRGMAVRKGRPYHVSLYARSEGFTGMLEASVGKDRGEFITAYADVELGPPGPKWEKRTGILTPDTTDPDAELIIRAHGTGVIHLDQVSLVPGDAIDGWRKDVVEAVRALKPNVLRFGGSAVIYYDWKMGIGPPDQRVPFPNQPWGGMEPNDVGMDEFIGFCRLVGAEPLICVSFNTGDAQDAAAQVQYCNGAADSQWGAVRAANGHPEPYRVRFWQVGNEQSGPEYEARLGEYCRAMREVDPDILIASDAPSAGVYAAAPLLDFVSPHYYTPSIRSVVDDLTRLEHELPVGHDGRRLRVAVTEWNHTAGDWGPPRARLGTQENALYCARVLHVYQRWSHLVRIANRSNLTNSWWAGVIQTDRDRLLVTPAYYTLQLFSNHSQPQPLSVTDEEGREFRGVEFAADLDVAATRDERGERVVVTMVNDQPRPVRKRLRIKGFTSARGERVTLAAHPEAMNDWPTPRAVRPVWRRFTYRPGMRLAVPAWSLTVIDLRR